MSVVSSLMQGGAYFQVPVFLARAGLRNEAWMSAEYFLRFTEQIIV